MGQKIGTIILVVVIIVAVVWVGISIFGSKAPKAEVLKKTPRVVINVASGEKVDEYSVEEWFKLPQDETTGYRKDPKGRTLSDILKCVSCGADIPAPPAGRNSNYVEVMSTYKCPKCGNSPIPRERWDPSMR